MTARSGLAIDVAPEIGQAAGAPRPPLPASSAPSVPISELWQGCCSQGCGAKGSAPAHRAPALFSLFSPLLWGRSVTSSGVPLGEQRRKRGEAQPALSLPCDLPARPRGRGVTGKGTSITSLSCFLGCGCCDRTRVQKCQESDAKQLLKFPSKIRKHVFTCSFY